MMPSRFTRLFSLGAVAIAVVAVVGAIAVLGKAYFDTRAKARSSYEKLRGIFVDDLVIRTRSGKNPEQWLLTEGPSGLKVVHQGEPRDLLDAAVAAGYEQSLSGVAAFLAEDYPPAEDLANDELARKASHLLIRNAVGFYTRVPHVNVWREDGHVVAIHFPPAGGRELEILVTEEDGELVERWYYADIELRQSLERE